MNNVTIGGTTAAAGKFTSVTDTGLTATHITFAGTGGLLSDSANLTYASGTLTIADSTASSDSTHGALVVTGGVGIGGDLHVGGNITGASNSSAQFFGDQYGFNALYAGYATFTELPNTPLQVTASKNDYAQINFQNYNDGNLASADYVATADNGSNYTGFIDMGIASGSYDGTQTGVLGPVVTANDGYLYVTGDTVTNVGGIPGVGVGNLVIGTTSANSQVKIVVASGSTGTHPSVVFNPYNTAATDPYSGTVVISGGLGVSGDLHVNGIINAASATFSSINDTPVGNLTPSTGAFTTLTVDNTTGNNVTLNPATTGTIDNITIGGTTPAAGSFTAFTVNAVGSTFTVAPATAGTLDNVAIGGTTAAAAHFTDLYTTNVSTTQVVFGGTNGVLQSDSGLTYGSGTLTVSTEVDVGSLKLSGSSVSSTSTSGSVNINTSPNGSTIYNWEFNTDGTTAFPNYTFPASTAGGNYYILTDATGNGSLSWVSTTLTINGDTATSSTLQLLSQTLIFAGDAGPVKVEVSGQTVTTTVDAATTSTLGLSSFDSTYFTVTSGNATITSGSIGNDRLTNSSIYVGSTSLSLGNASGSVTLQDVSIDGQANNVANSLSNGSNIQTFSYDGGTSGITVALSADISLTSVYASNSVESPNFYTDNLWLHDSTIESGDTTGSVDIVVSDGTTEKTWTFETTGNLEAPNNGRITNLHDPVDPQDAATRNYVDNVAQGLHVHAPALVATTDTLAAITGDTVTYDNGTDGVGAFITLSTAISSIDGITYSTIPHALANNSRILVKDEEKAGGLGQFANGVYTINAAGTRLTRATDFDTPPEVHGGDFVFVQYGTTQAATGWVQTQDTDTIGTHPIEFLQFAGAGTYQDGDGLLLTGNIFSVKVNDTNGGIEIYNDKVQLKSSVAGDGLTYNDGVISVGGTTDRITVSANAVDISTSYAGQTSITTLGTIATGAWHADAIGAVYGGTGQTTYAKGDILYASAANTLSKLPAGTDGQILTQQNGVPVWGYLDGGTY